MGSGVFTLGNESAAFANLGFAFAKRKSEFKLRRNDDGASGVEEAVFAVFLVAGKSVGEIIWPVVNVAATAICRNMNSPVNVEGCC